MYWGASRPFSEKIWYSPRQVKGIGKMIDYEKEFGKPGYAAGARQVQIAATFKIVYGWMCVGLALSGVVGCV